MNKILCFSVLFLIILLFVNKKDNMTDVSLKQRINDVIDSVYIIAVPNRKSYMKRVLNYYDIKGEFIDTIMKDTLDKKNLVNQKLLHYDHENQEKIFKRKEIGFSGLNTGRIACHLSHMKALKIFLKSDHENCLIFEDDIKMNNKKKVISKFVETIRSLPKGWEYANLGRCWDKCSKDKYVNNYLVRSIRPLCRHAYVVSRSGARKILNYCLPMKGYPGDHHYAEMVHKKLLNAFSSKEQIFFQNRETLGTNLGNNNIIKTCSPFTI
tara:strand:- start:514 stop:1314 length:801 start_codon:yes stop_codon:yes gene_type:complete